MTRAQEVRSKRLDKLNEVQKLKEEAQKAFEWILYLLDRRTSEGNFSPLILISNYNNTELMEKGRNYGGYRCACYTTTMFQALLEVVNGEEGYSAELSEEANHCLSLKIVIE